MPGQRAFERDIAAWYETLGNGEGMYGLAAIVSPQKICAALHPKQGVILEGTVYEAVAPRIPAAQQPPKLAFAQDRKSVVKGKSVSVRVYLGGRRIYKKKKKI